LACILSAITLAVLSIEPPGAVGTITRMVFSGNVWATALAETTLTPKSASAAMKRFISSSPRRLPAVF
jgi:hypothetical protein